MAAGGAGAAPELTHCRSTSCRRRPSRMAALLVALVCFLFGWKEPFAVPAGLPSKLRPVAPVSLEAPRRLAATKALAPTLPTAPLETRGEDDGSSSREVSSEDIARLRRAFSSNVYAVTTESELQELSNMVGKDGFLVVDYYASWCRACRRLLHQVEKLAREEEFRDVSFASVDFERSRELCKMKSVDKLPTLEIYYGDELRQRWSGASKQRLLERLGDEMAAAKVMQGEEIGQA
mmetsp:Transcript_111472/g.166980  ORF Transcript_111472/g.166980 Transcript_111472/m.166980 type:complete len:235 (+) Transcript_111472:101-805(+)